MEYLLMQQKFFKLNENLIKVAAEASEQCRSAFLEIEKISEYNSLKVLSAFIDNRVSETHFNGSTGYGYGDRGREVLDAVFAQTFCAEDALVRHNFLSGTHALTTALFGVLRTNDTLLACTGKPYDTLEEVIGIRGDGMGSLKDFGVQYKQVELLNDGNFDIEAILRALKDFNIKALYIQRSRGYSLRPSLTIEKIEQLCIEVKAISPQTCIMVDNCYGEFVETKEPLEVGADLIIGSLIKNPGGGMADTGGYIAGKKKYVELAAYRLTSPGMGKEVGCTLNQLKGMFKGLFFAPHVTSQALKTAVFAAALFELLGFEVTPNYNEKRTDIIQTIKLDSSEALVAFCQGMQKGAPVDSFVVPEAWDMPGYDSKVIMAAGAFTMGASIELSADAPLKPPFAAWMQGGLTYETGKMGVLLAAQSMLDKGFIKFKV